MLFNATFRAELCRSIGKFQKPSPYLTKRSFSTNEPEECDVVIVGGGPAGLALASALSSSDIVRQNLRIALVEAGDMSKIHDWTPPLDSYSNRISSLTTASQAFLNDIGIWDHVDMRRTLPIEEMQVWDGISDSRITFSASELRLDRPQDGMARLTENLNLQRGILKHLRQFPDIQLFEKTKVKSIYRDTDERGNWPLLLLDSGRVLRTRLLVGADGFNSPVRCFGKISSFGWAYDTQAIVCTMSHPPRGIYQNPNTTAYQRFLPTGPIAFLPLSPTISSLVWSTKPQVAAALLASEPAVLASMINAAFRLPDVSMRYLNRILVDGHATNSLPTHEQLKNEILWRERSHMIDETSAYASALTDESSPATVGVHAIHSESIPPLVTSIHPGTAASFPLRFNHTESYIGEGPGSRVVLVGDAAHTIHPLAGQGLNLGLGDVKSLAHCIHNAVLQGGDIGSYTSLLPYAQDRYFENHKIMSAVDKLHKLYSMQSKPVVWARSVGVEVLNELDVFKSAIMMTAGANGRVAPSNHWPLVTAQGVDCLVEGFQTLKVIEQGLRQVIAGGLDGIIKRFRESAPK